MKGFGIEIKNNLLDPKHIAKMSIAVWLYMWMIDHITSVDEGGIGKVLGGKPIKFEELELELGISMRTYRRWLSMLTNEGYINTKRTPYGIIISVNKAYKKFGHKTDVPKIVSDVPKVAHLKTKSGTSNKTVQLDKTIDKTEQSSEVKFSQEGADLIKSFEAINPNAKSFYARPPQRKASDELIKIYGLDRVKSVVEKTLPKTNTMPYFPTITTPIQLLEKWSSLEAGILKLKGKAKEKQEKYKIAFAN